MNPQTVARNVDSILKCRSCARDFGLHLECESEATIVGLTVYANCPGCQLSAEITLTRAQLGEQA